MKKFFLFAFVAFLFFIPFIGASAAVTWSPSMISGLGDLGLALAGGASFDFKNSKYIQGAVDIDQALAEQATQEFINDYILKRGINNLSPDDIPTSDFDYYKTYYYQSNVNRAWNNYRLAQTQEDQDVVLRFELSNSLFARWTGYNNVWYKNYIDNLTFEGSANIPDAYKQFLPQLSFGCTWDHFPVPARNYPYGNNFINNKYLNANVSLIYEPSEGMWGYPGRDLYNYFPESNGTIWAGLFAFDYNSFYIFYNTSNKTATLQNANYLSWEHDEYHTNLASGSIRKLSNQVPVYAANSYDTLSTSHTFNSDEDFFTWFGKYCANCRLAIGDSIDNVVFIGATDVIDNIPMLPPDFTDIIDMDSDDPAYDVVVPVDGVPAWFDLTSLFDAIKLAIIDAKNPSNTDDGVLDIDKVIDNSGIVDEDGEIVDTTTKDIADVLDDPIEIDNTQDYPVIPLYTPPVHNAFKGTSILAELIDGTQSVLPEELILTFWGIVFVIFILGLLKILHK